MDIVLTRTLLTPEYTLGFLFVDDLKLATLELPWLPNPNGPGGMPRKSCVPMGTYTVRPYSSPKFENVYQLTAPDVGVYAMPGDIPKGQEWGRSAILIHVGNSTADILGCVAVGLKHVSDRVISSRAAMEELRAKLGKDAHELSIVEA